MLASDDANEGFRIAKQLLHDESESVVIQTHSTAFRMVMGVTKAAQAGVHSAGILCDSARKRRNESQKSTQKRLGFIIIIAK